MKKHLRSALALLLVASLAFSMLAMASFAGGVNPYNLLVVGDSTAQGYMLSDYDGGNAAIGDHSSPSALPHQMKLYLEEKLGREVDLYNYCSTGWRPNEFYAVMEPGFKDYDGYCVEHIDDRDSEVFAELYELYKDGQEAGKFQSVFNYSDIYKCFNQAVTDADLIVYDLGMNNFGTYLCWRLMDLIDNGFEGNSPKWDDDYTDLIALSSPEAAKSIGDTRNFLYEKLGELLGSDNEQIVKIAKQAINMFLYCYGSYIVYFEKGIDKIYELNDDVQLIVVGMYNGMAGLTAQVGDIALPFGDIMGALYTSMNLYVTGVNAHCHQYKYADLSGGIEIFMDEISSGSMTEATAKVLLSDGSSKEALKSGAPEERILANFSAAANNKVIDLMGVFETMGKGEEEYGQLVVKALCEENFEEVDPGIRDFIHVYTRFLASNGVGTHPSLKGCQQITKAVIKAYNASYAANGALLVGVAKTTAFFGIDIIKKIISVVLDSIKRFFGC